MGSFYIMNIFPASSCKKPDFEDIKQLVRMKAYESTRSRMSRIIRSD